MSDLSEDGSVRDLDPAGRLKYDGLKTHEITVATEAIKTSSNCCEEKTERKCGKQLHPNKSCARERFRVLVWEGERRTIKPLHTSVRELLGVGIG